MYSQIITKTFNLIFEKRYSLVKALFIPFVLLTGIEYFLNPLTKDSIGTYNFYILGGVSFIITMIISILVHRILLLDIDKTSSWGLYKFGSREVNFILKAIGLTILLVVVFIGTTLILNFVGSLFKSILGDGLSKVFPFIGIALSSIFVGIIGGRFSLVFPAIAIDKPIDFTDSYLLTKKYKLLTFSMVIVIPILLGYLLEFVYGLAIEFLIGVISPNFSVLYSLLSVFITVITIGFLSVTYEFIISKQPEKIEKPINELLFEETKLGISIIIDDRSDITFEDIKEQLKKQYLSLGFTRTVVDKEDSWMAKDKDNEKSYILLSHKNDEYKIETFNVREKPVIEIEKQIYDKEIESIKKSKNQIHYSKDEFTFESLKEKIIDEYFEYGFCNISIDSDTKFVLKESLSKESFVSLSFVNDSYIIETFDAPLIEIKKEI